MQLSHKSGSVLFHFWMFNSRIIKFRQFSVVTIKPTDENWYATCFVTGARNGRSCILYKRKAIPRWQFGWIWITLGSTTIFESPLSMTLFNSTWKYMPLFTFWMLKPIYKDRDKCQINGYLGAFSVPLCYSGVNCQLYENSLAHFWFLYKRPRHDRWVFHW